MLTTIATSIEARSHLTPMTVGLILGLTMVSGLATAEEVDQEEHVVVERPVVVVRTSTHHPSFTWSMEGHRSFLGVQTVDLTPELREHFGVPLEAGVLIARIVEESPAEEGGLEVGDIISAVDGEAITSPSELARSIGHHDSGEIIDLDVWREGKIRQVRATLVERQGPAVDIRQFRLPEGRLKALDLSDTELEGAIELETETLNMAIERLNQELDSPEWHARIHTFKEHQGTLMKRIETLEQRLRELEMELEELADGD